MTHLEQQEPWTLSFRAKSKNLDFKFSASKILPVCKLSRFSIQLKLHKYLFEIKSQPDSSFSFKPNSLKQKFLQIFRIFQRKRIKNRGIVRSWYRKNYFYERRRAYLLLYVLLFAMVSCFLIRQLRTYFVWKYLCKALNYAAPSGLLYQFFQVIFNGICGYLGL
ncbi:hypothetical protein CDL12_05923 [Handroanthus impetiginosus]|uniref:Uncharacterized protein n=1 Tax=Handroanthus impetiginosus TaxID=429701 RepID=A0A2G9HV29_9LAMI|nr:hypothetical protein CDL12_05923 [Handroanthus impetiginosus]